MVRLITRASLLRVRSTPGVSLIYSSYIVTSVSCVPLLHYGYVQQTAPSQHWISAGADFPVPRRHRLAQYHGEALEASPA